MNAPAAGRDISLFWHALSAEGRMKAGEFQFDRENPAIGLASFARLTPHDPALPSVLCISRDQFADDLYALRKSGFSSHYNWLEIQAGQMTEVQRPWVPEQFARQAFQQDFDSEEAWERCAAFAEALLNKLRTKVDLVAVMSAHFDYWIDEGLRRACAKLGIPFLVLLREVWICPKLSDDYFRKYRFRPGIDGIAVASERTKSVLIKWDLVAEEKIVVTGLPRFDKWLGAPPPPAVRDSIVMFTFPGANYSADKTFRETLAEFVAASARHEGRGVDFVLKCKNALDLEDMEGILAAVPVHAVKCVSEASFPQLLGRARGIVGFNSLAMVESLLSPAALYSPFWGEAAMVEQVFSPEDSAVTPHVNFLRSPAELAATLDHLVAADPGIDRDPAQRQSLLKRFVDFTPDRPATRRVDAFVQAFAGKTLRR